MVEYLSGGRVQGSSTAEATPTYGGDDITDIGTFSPVGSSGDTFYVVEDTTNKTIDVKNAGNSGADGSPSIAYIDLGSSLSSTAWLLRYKLKFNTLTAESSGGKSFLTSFGIVDEADGAHGTGTEDGFKHYFIADAGSSQTQFKKLSGGSDSDWASMSWTPTETTIYVEMKFDSGTCTTKFYSDEFSTQLSGTSTVSKSGSFDDLRYFQFVLRQDTGGNGVMDIEVSDLKIYDGVTTTQTDEKTTITNVPANTRYEETDTRKIYRKVTPTQASFSDDFSSDNWTYSRAGTEIQITGGKMVFTDFQNGGQWRSAYRSTGLDINDTKWVLRFKFRFSAASSQSFWILGLSSGTSNPTGSSEYIVGAYFVDTPYMEIAKKSSSDSYRSWTGGNVFNPSADTDYYIQIIRTGETEVQMKMFTNSNFSDGLVGTNTQTIDSNYAGLDYLMISNQSNGSNTRTMTGEIDDIKIYNGVTSVDTDEWKERNTA